MYVLIHRVAKILGGLLLLASMWAFAPHASQQFSNQTPGTLSFTANAGSDQVFRVERWHFTEVVSADNPTEIKVKASLDISSIVCDWKELEASVKKKKDYFNVSKYQVATVEIEGARALEDGMYETDAMLTLKGISKVVPVQFTISPEAPYRIQATAVVKRKKFKFTGKGPKPEVPVSIDAVLEVNN